MNPDTSMEKPIGMPSRHQPKKQTNMTMAGKLTVLRPP